MFSWSERACAYLVKCRNHKSGRACVFLGQGVFGVRRKSHEFFLIQHGELLHALRAWPIAHADKGPHPPLVVLDKTENIEVEHALVWPCSRECLHKDKGGALRGFPKFEKERIVR